MMHEMWGLNSNDRLWVETAYQFQVAHGWPEARTTRAKALLFAMTLTFASSWAQDLRPRAYIVAPIHTNAVTVSEAYNDGSVYIGTVLPITNNSGHFSVPAVSFYHSLGLFNRSANVTGSLPYVVGNFQGIANGSQKTVYRSGLTDSVFRFAVNLSGGPALSPKDFPKWKQKTLVGASISLIAPTGQYYASHLINPGSNRWAFKPEIGLSHRWGNYILDTYGGAWFFTVNNDYLTGSEFSQTRNTLTQKSIGVAELHLSYDVKPRLWASIDGNYWYGGSTTVNGVTKIGSVQSNSRIGGTVSIPFNRHQSIKCSYSDDIFTRFGGSFQTVAVAWQYSWLGTTK